MSDPLVDYLAQYTTKAFDANAHPRGKVGTPTGGKFVPKSGGTTTPTGTSTHGQPVTDLGHAYAKFQLENQGNNPTIGHFHSAVVKPLEHQANQQRSLQRAREDTAKWHARLQATLEKSRSAAGASSGMASAGTAAQPTGRKARVEQLRHMIATLGTQSVKEANAGIDALAARLEAGQDMLDGGFYDFLLAEGVTHKGMFDLYRKAAPPGAPDVSKHPHQPAGSPTGGQFAPTGAPLGGRFPVSMGGGYQVNAAVPREAVIPQTAQAADRQHPGATFYPVYHSKSQSHAGYVSRNAQGVHAWDYLGQHMGAYPNMDAAANAVVKTHALKPKQAKPIFTAASKETA